MYRGAPRKYLYNRDYLTSFIRTKDYVEKKGGPLIQMRGCFSIEDKELNA